ncbi:MAG: thermonuclease family protein [Alphaproteobacteria bacterium]|nr:thermonuclease family protein [Alphaproteobacteria bacterium]
MYFLKKLFLGFGLLALIYGGSAGTQSSSLFVQGMSFVGLLIILVILYVFGKMLVRGLGCMPSVFVMLAIGIFMMYALGMFNNGITGIFDSVSRFIGRSDSQADYADQMPLPDNMVEPNDVQEDNEDEKEHNAQGELFEDYKAKQKQQKKPKSNSGVLSNVMSALSGKKQVQEPKPFNPLDYPVIYITPRIISGDTFEVGGHYFKLFGVAAPIANQTCADSKGRSYRCGRQAALWLKEWIEDGELECHVIQQDTTGNMVGTCSFGEYDIGAALVDAGWAVAYTKYTDVYLAYEQQAQRNRRGLWQGQFYKPWDWMKIQQRKGTVKVTRPKKKKRGLFG